MKYEKPEILILAAVAAVQSTAKSDPQVDNFGPPATYSNPPAYEADE